MHKNSNFNRRGFTLVEMVIVMLIVAVIAGTVVAGKDFLRSAAAKAIIADITYYSTALKQFEDQVGALPGLVRSPRLENTFTGNAAATCAPGGNPGFWHDDDAREMDIGFIQMSQLKFINAGLDFDPCALTKEETRYPGVHRPRARGSKTDGITFISRIELTAFATYPDQQVATGDAVNFLKVIKIGYPRAGSPNDYLLSQGSILVKTHREVDAKIDIPETPETGHYVVGHGECSAGSISGGAQGYLPDTSEMRCVAYWAEQFIPNSYVPNP